MAASGKRRGGGAKEMWERASEDLSPALKRLEGVELVSLCSSFSPQLGTLLTPAIVRLRSCSRATSSDRMRGYGSPTSRS